jgi:hypothetical protein
MPRLVLTVVLILALTGAARAATLFTPPLFLEGEGRLLVCHLTNVTAQSRSVQSRIFNAVGTVVVGTRNFTLAAGETELLDAAAAHIPRYCKFTVDGPKSTVRASACVTELGVGCIAAVTAQ